MVKVARAPGGKKATPPGKKPMPGKQPQQQNNNPILKTNKGVFSFTMVADGCYIEHKWGQNSGHIGVPLEAIPGFIAKLQGLYTRTTGTKIAANKSPGKTGPKATIAKGKKAKKPNEKKEKKEPAPKKTMEDLDAELMSYTAQRGADEAPPAEVS